MSATILLVAALLGAPERDTIVAVSGGASRGAYQAGILYALLNAPSDDSYDFALKGFTGTSSGAVNALLGALESCAKTRPRLPDESLLWEVWRELSWGAMFAGDLSCREYRAAFPWLNATCAGDGEAFGPRDGMITASSFNAIRSRLRDVLTDAERFENDCRRPLSISLTAERPEPLALGRYELPSTRRHVNLELRVMKEQRRNVMKICQTPLADLAGEERAQAEVQRLLLPFRPDGECDRVDPEDFLDAIFASASEPNLLPSVELTYCSATPCAGAETRGRCAAGMQACRGRFLDGSFFDKQPLYTAVTQPHAAPRTVLMLSPDLPSDPSEIPGQQPVLEPRGFAYYRRTLTNFVTVAGQYELETLRRNTQIATDQDDARKNGTPLLSVVQQSHLLVADLRLFDDSRFLGSMFAGMASFFDLDFRRHDYYLGIHDGLAWLRSNCREHEKRREGGEPQRCDRDWNELLAQAGIDTAPGLAYVVRNAESNRTTPWIPCQLDPAAAESMKRDRRYEIPARRQAERLIAISCALETTVHRTRELQQSSLDGTRDSDQFGLFAEALATPVRVPGAVTGDAPVEFSFDPPGELPYVKRYRTWRYDVLRQSLRRMGDVERSDGSKIAPAFTMGEYWAAVAASTWRDGWLIGGAGTIPQRIQHSELLSHAEKLVLPSSIRLRGRGRYLGIDGITGKVAGAPADVEVAWDLLSYHRGWPDRPSTFEVRHHFETQLALTQFPPRAAGQDAWNLGASFGYAVDPLVFAPWRALESFPQLGVRLRYSLLGELTHDGPGGGGPFALDVFARPLYGRLELGMRWSHLGEPGWHFFVGLGDVNGLVYWLLRGITGNDDTYHQVTGGALEKAKSAAGVP